MTTRLKPEDRALFNAAREGLAPTSADRARVAKGLGLRLGRSAGAVSAAANTAAGSVRSPAPAGISSGIVAAKWVTVIAVAVGAGTTGGIALHRAMTVTEPLAPRAAQGVQTPPPGAERASPGAPEPVAMTPGYSPSATEHRKPADVAPGPAVASLNSFEVTHARQVLTARPSERSAAPGPAAIVILPSPPAPSVQAAAETPSIRVAEEARLLRAAEVAFQGGDAQGATRWLDEHARLFPSGVLAEERDVQRVLVLCAEGRTDAARRETSRFLSAYPQSLLAERVRSSCGAR